MPTYLECPLGAQGYIHNWLIAGPQSISVADFDRFGAPAQFKTHLIHTFHDPMRTGSASAGGELAGLLPSLLTGMWRRLFSPCAGRLESLPHVQYQLGNSPG